MILKKTQYFLKLRVCSLIKEPSDIIYKLYTYNLPITTTVYTNNASI